MLLFLSGVALFSCLAILLAQDFRITQFSIGTNGKVTLQHSADTNYYYILYRGTEITNIVLAADMAIGTNSVGELTDPITLSTSNGAFYRVRQVPMNQPLDSDGDGIDDVYELHHKNFLNPLNPADASQDPDGDGFSNLQEYVKGTNPAVSEYVAPTATAPVISTKEMTITLTGTAQPNRLIKVEGGSATVTIMAGANGAYSVGVPLQPNRLNRLYVSAIDASGNPSAPRAVEVIQDSQPPSLFIDFLADNAVLTTSNTVIAGRVVKGSVSDFGRVIDQAFPTCVSRGG